ncbi:cupin domain-containing protein [Teichococcus vastitatis]|jgi:mannose-6-phosphate isomerase-like protein (cupin superfamily)|uniref:Cupin domain-containing protein n=1 Tax=Teichococcus vastitatis TaxID=2307076 RepID=A0ABS9VZN1_9PROT|nr:cupin domain-containing protein [Pseudoroseomonas vastitatis]MCI0752457.1 cupin domain-containing protein [Pseudoroseomonas vastitatis]
MGDTRLGGGKPITEPLRCRPPATATLQLDTDTLRTTRWDFPPGAETGWHRHGWAYVVVPLHEGRMMLELPGGATADVAISPGISYERPPGAEHNVVNAGDTAFSFIEIELKAYPG